MTPEQEHLIDDILNLARPAGISPGAWAALRAMRDEWRDARAIRAVHEQWEKFTRSVEPVQAVTPPDPIQSRLDAMERDLTDMWQRIHTICNNRPTPLSRHENLAKCVEQISERLGVQERGWRELSERLLVLEKRTAAHL